MQASNHTHTRQQAHQHYIDYWNNNRAFIIDLVVLFAYEIHAVSSNQGHNSITKNQTKASHCSGSRKENIIRVINKSTLFFFFAKQVF